jgi:hypothetical protein
VVEGEVVGWVDHDHDPEHDWLDLNEVNLGYFVFVKHRRKGYAARSVELFLHLLRENKHYTTASLLIDPENAPSLAVARRRADIPLACQSNGLGCNKPSPTTRVDGQAQNDARRSGAKSTEPAISGLQRELPAP